MGKVNVYTSTGGKMIHHPGAVYKFKETSIPTPISLQLAPTSRCQLNCVFCSNANREKHEDLDILVVKDLLLKLRNYGLKTVEWTGGGDPTMWEPIVEAVDFAHNIGLEQGFISNGITVERVLGKYVQFFKWLRISLNSLDYVNKIDVPKIKGTLGFSYVMNEKTTEETIETLRNYAHLFNPAYIRIVPNCQATDEEQQENNDRFSKMVEKWGEPFFYQRKEFGKPKRCWWGYFKPFVLHNGWVYPCSSVVLNEDSDKSFHHKYQWKTISQLVRSYEFSAVPYDPKDCDHCVFKSQNDIVDSIIHPSGMENFV